MVNELLRDRRSARAGSPPQGSGLLRGLPAPAESAIQHAIVGWTNNNRNGSNDGAIHHVPVDFRT